ncbi:HAMP domain-containing protein, partial [Mangrovicella endophytica]|uniref:HAMP domain-containing protein n=1 Tax=Mangrovicella endophytica TaxID=2066697 RepID=UPI0018E433C4
MANCLGYSIYRAITYGPTDPQTQKSVDLAHTDIQLGLKLFEGINEKLPDHVAELNDLKQSFDKIISYVQPALDAALADDDEKAKQIMAVADPLITDFATKTYTLNTALEARGNQRSDELSAMSQSSSTTLLVGSLAAAIIGLIAAMLVTSKGITGPIERLRKAMSELAGGKLDIEIEGKSQKDEVGAMARAVQIFKDAAIEKQHADAEA